MTPSQLPEPNAKVAGYLFGGMAVMIALLGGLSVWAAKTDIAGAVLASGMVVVESQVKKVQHPTGGVVAEIRVRGGDEVTAGDLLVRLDETVTQASLQVVAKQLDELIAREARLIAERDGVASIDIPRHFASRESEEGVMKILTGEQTFFESRRQSRDGQKAQLRERVSQLEEEIRGLERQIAAKGQESELIGRELEGVSKLEEKQLVTTMRVTQLRREAARLGGEKGQLESALAQAKGRITEIELQILRIDQDFKTELMQELRDNQAKQAELVERRIAAEDQLKRVDIRAPQSGIVHQLAVHTVGGVINPAEPIMLIVPKGDDLMVEARVAPQDIDQVLAGAQAAFVRFSAFDHRTTPELLGRVKTVAADLAKDSVTGEAFYLVRLTISEDELRKLEGKNLVPGMPADVYIRTQDRTVLSYLIKPVQDQIARAFRER